ncbi:hypothetical protein K438DRAFT_1937333 [Mycena galopus ATCC 62051]|nr:hypothetical protein K438DRAFT_1937333 [Mycena galopus ATCC 62051]
MLQDMAILHQACAATTTRPAATVSARTQSDHMYALSSTLAANVTPPRDHCAQRGGLLSTPEVDDTVSKQSQIVLALVQRDQEQSTGPPCGARFRGRCWGSPHSCRPLRAAGDGRTLGRPRNYDFPCTTRVLCPLDMVSPRRIVYGRTGRGRRRDEEGGTLQDGKSGRAAHERRAGQQREREREDGRGSGSAR